MDPWEELKSFTDARIAQGRCGTSLPVKKNLEFKLHHARARDAVTEMFKADVLNEKFQNLGFPSYVLQSNAKSKDEFLLRPDKGKSVNAKSCALIEGINKKYDICFVISNGLSSPAIHENGVDFIINFMNVVKNTEFLVSPIFIVINGRVAIADDISEHIKSRLSIILIGERPGLSSPNSMGIYITYNPKKGTTDEKRNCISNIRKGGMSIVDGVNKCAYLVEEAFKQKQTGVHLKDRMSKNYLPFSSFISSS